MRGCYRVTWLCEWSGQVRVCGVRTDEGTAEHKISGGTGQQVTEVYLSDGQERFLMQPDSRESQGQLEPHATAPEVH